MKVTRETRTIFIEADSTREFDRKVNEAMRGLVNAHIQIYGLYQGAIVYDEFIYEEEQKTIADLFEEAGCGKKCADCPCFEKSEDQRRKWHRCTLKDRKTREDSRACDSYYLREEGKSEVSKIKRGNEEARNEDGRRSRQSQDHADVTLQQNDWTHGFSGIGEGIPVAVLQSSARGVI